MQVVTELMASTFVMRRRDIIENPCDVCTLFVKYPFLGNVQQLMLEMCRIADDDEWNIKGEVKWTEMQIRIMKQATLEASHNKRLRDKLEEWETSDCNHSLLSVIALTYLLPDKTRPDSEKMIYFTNGASNLSSIISERKQPQPFALVTGNIHSPEQAFLAVDCNLIGEVPLDAIPLYIVAAYFVFNICYIKGCHNVFAFFEALLFPVTGSSMPSTVQHFMAALNNLSL
ncbi:PREDICTED: uncharacterized protein LOC109582011 [Amphimedon queenslandica]|uniref:Uncharacterized protein n=1 Tax=Amphimedon queenslandica TaxID=400682 RepID=A0AAN0J5U8_AMPQE|nr:PREDICTED: uncharacterized protein LOC109582011 [Amphimedon queenslandica]|eukprot:XP_019852127.1 PREDICTED: uncharacterized protein LOC109582011 [Amphimedon queenslandica]